MSRNVAKLISELLAFVMVVGILGLVAHPLITGLVIVNSIAGAVVTDLNQVYVPPTWQIQNNRISLTWGMRKMWRNTTWWRR